MPLTDLKRHPVYNHGNCPDISAGQLERTLSLDVNNCGGVTVYHRPDDCLQ